MINHARNIKKQHVIVSKIGNPRIRSSKLQKIRISFKNLHSSLVQSNPSLDFSPTILQIHKNRQISKSPAHFPHHTHPNRFSPPEIKTREPEPGPATERHYIHLPFLRKQSFQLLEVIRHRIVPSFPLERLHVVVGQIRPNGVVHHVPQLRHLHLRTPRRRRPPEHVPYRPLRQRRLRRIPHVHRLHQNRRPLGSAADNQRCCHGAFPYKTGQRLHSGKLYGHHGSDPRNRRWTENESLGDVIGFGEPE
ncbi:hypothetical protein LINGRAHAP2_LOCUS26348 [Linum grandiflorum]